MGVPCWITKAADTHSEYVILFAFPLQQWLHERVSVLRYAYIGCIVNNMSVDLEVSAAKWLRTPIL